MKKELNELYTSDKIVINGHMIGTRETTVLIELIVAAIDHGVQNSNFLEEACGINKDEQRKIVEKLEQLLSRDMEPVEDDTMKHFNYLDGNELISLLIELKELGLREKYDPRVIAFFDLVINNGDVVESLVEDLNEH